MYSPSAVRTLEKLTINGRVCASDRAGPYVADNGTGALRGSGLIGGLTEQSLEACHVPALQVLSLSMYKSPRCENRY